MSVRGIAGAIAKVNAITNAYAIKSEHQNHINNINHKGGLTEGIHLSKVLKIIGFVLAVLGPLGIVYGCAITMLKKDGEHLFDYTSIALGKRMTTLAVIVSIILGLLFFLESL